MKGRLVSGVLCCVPWVFHRARAHTYVRTVMEAERMLLGAVVGLAGRDA